MTNPDQLSGIIKRILDGSITDSDRQTLQNWVQVGSQQQIVQVGKYNVNIGEGKHVQMGDRHRLIAPVVQKLNFGVSQQNSFLDIQVNLL